jgi:hypothetical protein
MSELLWVALGGLIGAAAMVTITWRWPGQAASLAAILSASAMLGAFAATGPHGNVDVGLVGFGALGTAASLPFVLGDTKAIPTTSPDAVQFLRRFGRVLAMKAFLCAAFAMLGYLSADLVSLLYDRLLWS